ncbi:MAG: hypothetical protein ACRD3W_17315 [Terriglobales bacterium]
MSVQPGARLRLAVNSSYDMANPFVEGMLKSFGDRNIVTERRRVMIGDVGGSRRPINFINDASAEAPPAQNTRSKMISRLRKLERKVLILKGLHEFLTGWFGTAQRHNPFHSHVDQLRLAPR